VLELLGLPVSYRAQAWPDLLATMRVDKKSRGSKLRFVVLDAVGRPSILSGPSEELLADVYREVSS
jgi:3-dehydroquinate synthase